jgi:cytochrome c-type biogenesis protein
MGLITVFTFIGLLASFLGEILPQIVPLLDLVAGVFLIVMGVLTLKEVQLPYPTLPVGLSRRRDLLGLYAFGVAYGLAGVGCSAPIFLSVLLYSISKGITVGVLSFILYALGMGAPLILTTILLAQTKGYIINRIKSFTPWLQKLSGAILILVGLYLFYFYYITYA